MRRGRSPGPGSMGVHSKPEESQEGPAARAARRRSSRSRSTCTSQSPRRESGPDIEARAERLPETRGAVGGGPELGGKGLHERAARGPRRPARRSRSAGRLARSELPLHRRRDLAGFTQGDPAVLEDQAASPARSSGPGPTRRRRGGRAAGADPRALRRSRSVARTSTSASTRAPSGVAPARGPERRAARRPARRAAGPRRPAGRSSGSETAPSSLERDPVLAAPRGRVEVPPSGERRPGAPPGRRRPARRRGRTAPAPTPPAPARPAPRGAPPPRARPGRARRAARRGRTTTRSARRTRPAGAPPEHGHGREPGAEQEVEAGLPDLHRPEALLGAPSRPVPG